MNLMKNSIIHILDLCIIHCCKTMENLKFKSLKNPVKDNQNITISHYRI